MSDLSNYSENALLNHVYGNVAYTPATTLYLDLFSTSPDFEAGTGGTSVLASRVAITNNTTNFPAATNGAKSNGTIIATSTNSSGSSWSIVSAGIYDASSGGNLLVGKAFSGTQTVTVGSIFRFPVGSLTITVSGFSNFLSSKLCDLMFGATAYTAPTTVYFAGFTTNPNFATGVGGTEASGGNYARASATNNTTNFPNASGGLKSNATVIAFPTPSVDLGTWNGIGVYDAATTGNFLGGAVLSSPKNATTGSPLSIEIGDFDVSLG